MSNFKHMSILEVVEGYASDNNLIDSEEALSERFDEMLKDCVLPNMEYDERSSFEEDAPMISESFSNFADSLESDGELHQEQVSNYDYVGVFS